MQRTLKIMAIAGVVLLLAWAGERFGPPRVEAEVFQVLDTSSTALPPLLAEVGVRRHRGHGRGAGGTRDGYQPAYWRGAVKTLIERLQAIAGRGAASREYSHLAFDAGYWGYFARLPVTQGAGQEGFVLLAFEDANGIGAELWVRPLSGVSDLARLLFERPGGQPAGDAVRFPNATTLYTYRRKLNDGELWVSAYRADGGTAEHADFFKRAFRGRGWRLIAEHNPPGQSILEFTDGKREASVYIAPMAGGRGGTSDVVHYRAHEKRGS